MKKLDLYDQEIYEGFMDECDLSWEDGLKYMKEFEHSFDTKVFQNRYEVRTKLFEREDLTYKEIMSGCYDVITDKKTLDWNLARNIFIDLVEKGEFMELENGRFVLNNNTVMKNTQVADAGTSARRDGAFLRGLRVRIKELAQEAKYIRLEETKIKNSKLYNSDYDELTSEKKKIVNRLYGDRGKLRTHRTVEVRNAARAAQLAYGFLREVPYKVIEPKTYTDSYKMGQIKKEVKRLATKFGGLGYGKNYDNEVDEWFNA